MHKDDLEQLKAILDNAQSFVVAFDLQVAFRELQTEDIKFSPLTTEIEKGVQIIDKYLEKDKENE